MPGGEVESCQAWRLGNRCPYHSQTFFSADETLAGRRARGPA